MRLTRRDLLRGMGAAAAVAGCTSKPPSVAVSTMPSAAPQSVPSSSKRILILGGTGFVGPAIVNAARANGHVLTMFNRGKTNPHLFPDVETIIGDRRTDMDRLKGRDWDAVIDTWASLPRGVRTAAELLRDHVGQYLFVSTISVYKLGRDPIDEGSPVLTISDPTIEKVDDNTYGPLKALAEQAAEKAMPGRVTSVRSGVIVGPGDPSDRFIYWPERMTRGGEMIVPGVPTDRMQFIDVRDLGEWMVGAVEKRTVGTYNIVGPRDPSLGVILDACKSALASDVRFEWIESAWLDKNDASGWAAFPLAVPHDADDSGFGKVSAARALATGLRYRPTGETAKAALDWWNAQTEERRAKKRPGLSADREADLLKRWHARATSPATQ
jgi:2'-hydroxyisoflavone reductase